MNDRNLPPPPSNPQAPAWVNNVDLYTSVPKHIHPAFVRYVDSGLKTGRFLEAILTNNLYNACVMADDVNRLVLWDIVHFVRQVVPLVCRGSKNDFKTWIMMSDKSRERLLFGAREWAIFKEWYDEQESKQSDVSGARRE